MKSDCHPVGIDEACLQIVNYDSINNYELWAQSEECYECKPWKYLSMNHYGNYSLTVNSTYLTEIFFYQPSTQQVEHGLKFHFVQHGIYLLTLNSSNVSSIFTLKHGNNEYISILVALGFFIALYLSWLCVLGLQAKMHEERRYPRPITVSHDSITHLLNDHSLEVNQLSYSQPAGHRVETDPDVTAAPVSLPDTLSISSRLQSLDTFRGIAIVLMIFVNYGGGKFYFFRHARWNGLTIADLVFPWFLWIMGVSLTFSVKSQLRRMTPYRIILLRIFKRSLVLFVLGLIVNSLKTNDLNTFRIPGVLQRFAFCYLITAMVEAFRMKPQDSTQYFRLWFLQDLVWSWVQWILIICLVTVHIIVTFLVSVPGCPKGYLGPGGLHDNGLYPNCTGGAAGYIDQLIFGKNHIHQHPTCKDIYDNPGPFDPEGILGILTSCLTVQLGVAAGRIINTYPNHPQRIRRLICWALILSLAAGFLCNWSKEDGVIPVNKNLWSVSYVFVTASFAFILFSFVYYVVDVQKIWNGIPFRVAGLNSILLYVGHELTGNLFPWSWSPVGKNHTEHLCMNLWGTSLWIIIAYLCHKKKLYFSV